jgi:hypothetical protein
MRLAILSKGTGKGGNGETIVAAEIRWPDGRLQKVTGFKANVQIRVTAS